MLRSSLFPCGDGPSLPVIGRQVMRTSSHHVHKTDHMRGRVPHEEEREEGEKEEGEEKRQQW